MGIRILFIAIAVMFISGQPVYAASDTASKWDIIADQISYDQDGDQFIAEGGVIITSEDKKLTADYARYDKKNKMIYS